MIIPVCCLLRLRSHLSRSVMISVGFSILGVTGLHFVNSGIKINGKYYRETLLKEELLPDMRDFSEYFIFQQDSVPAKETVDLSTETIAFTPTDSPDLNPVYCKVWSLLHEQVYKVNVNNFERIQTVWDELDQGIIDKAIKQWRTSLRACVEAKGGHFEHKL